MKKILPAISLCLCFYQSNSQCTPAVIREAVSINTPNYALNTAFNANPTASAVINNLSNGLLNFTGTVSGTATWSLGVQLRNDPTVGDHIFVQPSNTDNASSANVGTYTLNYSEPIHNLSFRIGGMNNLDQARVTAFNGATPITINAANFSNIINDPGNGGTITISGNTATSNNTAGGFGVVTNSVRVSIPGPVTRIVIYTGKGDNGNSTVTLGFTSLSFTRCVSVPPDINATFVNEAITGNVGTNDIKPSGTTYGSATALPGNPGPAIPTINSNGTYSFTSAVAGVFKFTVPMCPPSVVVPDCPNVPLVITVSEPTVDTNNPFANIDRATTPINTPVILNTLANDKTGNNTAIALNPASVTVTISPLNGTTSVNPANGNISYTPNPGFTGFDTLTYRVCDLSAPTPKCATSMQIVTIEPASITNSTIATDDYNSTSLNTSITNGNVKPNDNDPQGNTQTIAAQTTTVPGKGTLVLNTDGTYVFTPATGFSGPVNFPYQTCDNGLPSVCSNATLYILIFPLSTLPLDIISFTASINNANTELAWVSANAVNVNRFEIERSSISPVSFSTVGVVSFRNNSPGNYSFTDINAKNSITKGYYRLKIIDNDGRITYSKVVLVNFGSDIVFSVKPTIITGGQPISVLTGSSITGKKYSAILYNHSGQRIQLQTGLTGSTLEFSTDQLSKGLYVLKVLFENQVKTEKIMVQ